MKRLLRLIFCTLLILTMSVSLCFAASKTLDIPKDLKVVLVQGNTVTISFELNGYADYIDCYYSETKDGRYVPSKENGSFEYYGGNTTVDLPKTNHTYYVRLQVKNYVDSGSHYYLEQRDMLEGGMSAPIRVRTGPSKKVTGVKQIKTGTEYVTLSWKKTPGAKSYRIAYKGKVRYIKKAQIKLRVRRCQTEDIVISPCLKSRVCGKAVNLKLYPRPLKPKKLAVKRDGRSAKVSWKAEAEEQVIEPARRGAYEEPICQGCYMKNYSTGIQYQLYSADGKKLRNVTRKNINPAVNLKKLNKKKSYTFKVRYYKQVGKKKYYSVWSKIRV